jgi:glycosyltransferase domain-containing protein
MLTAQKYSLLIPTFNRPALLEALIRYLSDKCVSFPICILDSGNEESKALNRTIVRRYKLDLRYREFAPITRFDAKVRAILTEITSDYVSLCADDDIVFADAVEACVRELDRDPELALCHGVYLNLAVADRVAKLTVEYASPSLDADGPIERVCQLLTQYEALHYAVYRRTVMAETMDALSKSPDSLFWELLSAMVSIAHGKAKRLTDIYYIRRAHERSARVDQHPTSWIAADPDQFMRAFCDHRERLFAYFERKGLSISADDRKILDQAHVIYACRELRDGTPLQRALAEGGSPLGRLTPSSVVERNKSSARQSVVASFSRAARRRFSRYLAGAGTVKFKANRNTSVVFESSPNLRALLSPEMIADIAQTIDHLHSAPKLD